MELWRGGVPKFGPVLRIHYLPQFILREFKGHPSLLELNRSTREIFRRDIEKAGQRGDFWPEGIERGVMQRMDDHAAKIIQKKVYRQSRIKLSLEERQRLSGWIGLWMIRVPNHLRRCAKSRAEFVQEIQDFIADPYRSASPYPLWWVTRNRDYFYAIRHRLGSLGMAYLYVLAQMAKISTAPDARIEPAEDTFVKFLDEANFNRYAFHIQRFNWNWLVSENEPFIIGDDPVCRFGVSSAVSTS